mmetsp:Transcript_58516/g.102873  ORF Transcript_58516/g.102873 Transcript_58516/m.102873 type:complete len:201 (+) Transcript_58516:734-1336(+)
MVLLVLHQLDGLSCSAFVAVLCAATAADAGEGAPSRHCLLYHPQTPSWLPRRPHVLSLFCADRLRPSHTTSFDRSTKSRFFSAFSWTPGYCGAWWPWLSRLAFHLCLPLSVRCRSCSLNGAATIEISVNFAPMLPFLTDYLVCSAAWVYSFSTAYQALWEVVHRRTLDHWHNGDATLLAIASSHLRSAAQRRAFSQTDGL